MWKFLVFFKFLVFLNYASAGYGGPFLFWGHSKLVDVKLPALRSIDENALANLYQEAKSIMIFLRNGSVQLDKEDYPRLAETLSKNQWAYLPQQNLPVEPYDFNSNLEIVTLTGDPSHQDVEMTALYNDAVTIYGPGQVLAVLACKEMEGHYMYKRDAEEPTTPSSVPGETETNFVYIADGKAILYTTSAPILHLNVSGNMERFELEEHEKLMTFDDRGDFGRLSIPFKVDGNNVLRLRFNFTLAGGYWTMSATNIEYKDMDTTFSISRRSCIPEAPIGFSYRCSSIEMCFHGADGNLTIKDFQVQPWLTMNNQFSDAYDCVGFVTVPILSGFFVCSILIGILIVAITLLMDMKPPQRFENNRSKQLTFTVQE